MTYFTDPGAVLNSLSHSNTSKRELHYLMGNLSDILSALHADHHGGDARCTLHVLTKSRSLLLIGKMPLIYYLAVEYIHPDYNDLKETAY